MSLSAPIKVLEVDILSDITDIALGQAQDGATYHGAMFVVRSGSAILGTCECAAASGHIGKDQVVAALQSGDFLEWEPKCHSGTPDASGQSLPSASVIIATRDRTESLLRCLASLLHQDHPDFEIIIVDNAPSDDRTAQAVAAEYGHMEDIRYIREMRPGLAVAHNAGFRAARHRILAFTDDDVIADPSWLSTLCKTFVAFPSAGCVTGLIMPAELETRAQVWAERHGGFSKGFETVRFDLKGNRRNSPLYPFTAGQFGSGANMAFTADALLRMQGFDECLGAGTKARGGDDLDSFFRVITEGYQIVYQPQAMIWHFHRREEDGMARQAYGYGMGLGAYITKCATSDIRNFWKLTRGFATGLQHMFGKSSQRASRLPSDYPSELIWNEKKGIVAGIFGYYKSKAQAKQVALQPLNAAGRNVVWRA